MDRFDLYEQCVQSPAHLVPMLRAMHGRAPNTLGEDFAGTAALSIRWVEETTGGRAIAVDLDAKALAKHPDHPAVQKITADVRTVEVPVDLLFVGNFSIGYWHTRADLVAYLRHARARLAASSGVFICDTYGGETAFITGEVHRDHWITKGPQAGNRIRYTWEQRDADPITGMVTDVLHFQLERAGVVEQEWPDAFIYRWRLWSLPELTDAMTEAGFASVDVYDRTPSAIDGEGQVYMQPVLSGEDLDDSFIVCLAART